jgi:hypothetical protein
MEEGPSNDHLEFMKSNKIDFYRYIVLKTFMRRLKLKTSIFRPKMLDSNDYENLGDKSHVDREKKKGYNLFKKAEKTLKKISRFLTLDDTAQEAKSFWNQIPLIDPKSKFLFIWDFINFFCIIFTILFVPIEMSIKENFTEILGDPYTHLIIFCIVIFFLDMCLK